MNSLSLVHGVLVDLHVRPITNFLKSATIASSTTKSFFTTCGSAPAARRACRLRRELLGVGGEQAAVEQRAAEARRVEALDRTVEALVGLDAAAAVHLAAAVRELQLSRLCGRSPDPSACR